MNGERDRETEGTHIIHKCKACLITGKLNSNHVLLEHCNNILRKGTEERVREDNSANTIVNGVLIRLWCQIVRLSATLCDDASL